MSRRRGFGDETWRLARAGDAAGLERAAQLLLRNGTDTEYEGRRARAFRLALERRTSEALRELAEGWAEDWPPPSAYALDVSRVHYLAGDPVRALTAIELELRGLSRWEGVSELAAACVGRDRRLWRRGLRVAAAAERGPRKLRAVAAVLRARADAAPAAAGTVPEPTPES
jgi:hypothetical protein